MTLKRKIEINGKEFVVFGKAPWTTIPVAAIPTKNIPACHIIIEASLLGYVLRNGNKHRFNALTSLGTKGALIGVAFLGEEGKARADEILLILNAKMDK